VEIVSLIEEAKIKAGKKKGYSFRDWIFGHNQWVSRWASLVPNVTNHILSCRFIRVLMEMMLGIKNRPFPRYQKPFSGHNSGTKNGDLKVAYFTGCYSRFNEPAIAQSVVSILENCGVEIVVPPQKCCGVPLVSNGLTKEAEKNARFNREILGKLADQGFLIVTSCPSCALRLKEEEKIAAKVYDICEFLLDYHLLDQKRFSPEKKRYFYHQPCHAKAQGIGLPALKLLELIPELTMVSGEQKCCGQAGTYGFKKEKYQTSAAIGKKLFQDVARADVDGVVTDCGMCSLQLSEGTGKKVLHPVIVLDSSLLRENVPSRN